MRQYARAIAAVALCIALPGCTLSRPDYIAPDVAVGASAFVRAIEAHTLSGLIEGNRADVLVNGDEILPAMLAAIRGARTTITFANFSYEDGEVARELVEALAERCRAGVGVNVLVDAIGSSGMPKALGRTLAASGCHFARYHPVRPLTIRRVTCSSCSPSTRRGRRSRSPIPTSCRTRGWPGRSPTPPAGAST